mgnify:CR=1 FL=1
MSQQQTAGSRSASLYRMVMPSHICPYGLKSKDLLERAGYTVEDHHLKSREETDAFKRRRHLSMGPGLAVMTICDASWASLSPIPKPPAIARSSCCSH